MSGIPFTVDEDDEDDVVDFRTHVIVEVFVRNRWYVGKGQLKSKLGFLISIFGRR